MNSSDDNTPRLSKNEHSSVLNLRCLYKPAGSIQAIHRRQITVIEIILSMTLGLPLLFIAETTNSRILNKSRNPVQNRPLDVNGPV